jgi:hypothetical protein
LGAVKVDGCAAAISERLEFDGGAAGRMEEPVDEKEDNEAEEPDSWTPPGWPRRCASCLRKGIMCGKWQKTGKKSLMKIGD